jgi:hypothetical protein
MTLLPVMLVPTGMQPSRIPELTVIASLENSAQQTLNYIVHRRGMSRNKRKARSRV